MAGNTLPDEQLAQMRLNGILESDEVAVSEGDLLVAVNVITGARRLLRDKPLSESAKNKRLLKG
tara:strand:+ start:105 stop:296 length:192 start_codon:yes stop_codon:yes gene_type:complete